MNIRKLKWLYPGMLVKRWIFLCVFGVLMINMGFVVVIFENNSDNKAIAGLIIVLGIFCVIIAVKRILSSFMSVLVPSPSMSGNNRLVEKVYEKRILEKGPKIVVVGGGTGLSTMLKGLKNKTSNITAIVTVADDGGSSGRLQEEFGVLPPGDIRNCLVALSDSGDLLSDLFQFRFKQGTGLDGHNFGNLFITALVRVTGDFASAIRESSKVLAIRGKVFPATLQTVKLVVKRENTPRFERVPVKFDEPRQSRFGGVHGRASRGRGVALGHGRRSSPNGEGPRRSSPDSRGRQQRGERNKRSSGSRDGFRGGGRNVRQRISRH